MAFGKTAEEKATAASAKAAAEAEKQRAAEEAAFRASPVGQALTAKEQGQGFFEVQLVVGQSQRDSTIFGGANFALGKQRQASHAGTLAAIESVGWRLEHTGYVFMVTGQSSRDKFMASGQQTAVSGSTIGIYLFRNVDT